MKLPVSGRERTPANLDPRWAEISDGVHRLDGQLLVVLDVEDVLGHGPETLAA
jgi:purine-binding chemotaxis protein CheW